METKLNQIAELFIAHFRDVRLVPCVSNYRISSDPSTGNTFAEFFLEDLYAHSHKVILEINQWNDFTWLSNGRRLSISIPRNHNLLNSQKVLNLYARYFFWLSEVNPEECTEIPDSKQIQSYLRNCQNIYLEVIQDVLVSRNLIFLAEVDRLEALITELNDGYFHLNVQERFIEFCFNRNRYIINTPSMLQHKMNFDFLSLIEDYTHMLFDDSN